MDGWMDGWMDSGIVIGTEGLAHHNRDRYCNCCTYDRYIESKYQGIRRKRRTDKSDTPYI